MRAILLAMAASLLLTGCASGGTDSTPTPPQSAATCQSDKVTGFVGQTATAALGAQMLAASGARTLRWAPPRTALTMDFRPDRLTVAYDDDMVIISARCG